MDRDHRSSDTVESMTTAPIRRRLAAVVTCIALAFGTFGYMQRDVSAAVDDLPHTPPAGCDNAVKDHHVLDCLTLLGD